MAREVKADVGAMERMRRAASKRAFAISDELRKSASAIRSTRPKAVVEWPRIGDGVLRYRQFSSIRRSRSQFAGFIFGFVVPALIVVSYVNFGMSNQYTSEARFAVRGGERVSADPIESLTGLSSFTQAQDSLIVGNYVRSQAIVEDLEHTIGLRETFSRGDVDWLSRFKREDPIENLVKYWRWKIKTNIESPSGIITIRVSAFSPADALRIANAVVSSSERLINTLSSRALHDAM
jgi:capsular polysaccharide transport system permease protein